MKRNILLGAFLAALTLALLAACGASSSATTTSNSSYTVTMSAVSFNVTSITVPKGSTITFTTEQSGTAHNLVNGTSGQPRAESGTPAFVTGGQTVGPGQSWTTEPWTIAGTFHVTCTYHPTTMNLTVTVTG